MLPQQDIDNIIHASRACDEGPTQLARRIESAVEAAERERCAAVLRARIEKIAAKAERAAINEPDEESALRAMAWQLTVAEREILWPNVKLTGKAGAEAAKDA